MNLQTIESILHDHYVDGTNLYHNYVSLINPKGKFWFNRTDIEKFMDAYCTSIKESNGQAIYGVAEMPQSCLPVLVDVDIKIQETEDISIDKNVYGDHHVAKVVNIYQSILRNIVEDCTDENLICVLLEKEAYRKVRNGATYISRGFHLHFPNLFLSKTDQEFHLIPRAQDLLRESEIFFDLGFADSGSVIDKASITVPWLLYGSRKDPELEPYLVTKVFDSEGNIITLQDAFRRYMIFDDDEKPIDLKGRYKFFLPRILSIHPFGRRQSDLKFGLISPLKEKIKSKKIQKNTNESVSELLAKSAKLMPLVSDARSSNYQDWMNIGWILYNIGDGSEEALQQWIEFSERDKEKFDEGKCLLEWDKMVKKDITLGSLNWIAKTDSPEAYKKYKQDLNDQYLKDTLCGSTNFDIAKILFNEYSEDFVCASIINKEWYQFIDNKWERIEEGVNLREKISVDIVNKYMKMFEDVSKKIITNVTAGGDKAENSADAYRQKEIMKTIKNLKKNSEKRSIMCEASDLFYDKKFKQKLNANPYLIGVQNGVIDLKLNIFRLGRPEDYISKCMPWDFKEYKEDDEEIIEVENYFEKVFPDKSVRAFFINRYAEIFVGGNHRKEGIFWSGDGDNAKSVTQGIFEKMLGPYAVKIPTTVLTSKKVASGGANAELSRLGDGTRLAVAEEPDKDEMINVGTYKNLTGNDTFFARDLFEKGKDNKEINPLFKLTIISNGLPRMKNPDRATWNRTKVIPFESTFCRPSDPAPESYAEQLRQKRFPMDPNFSEKVTRLIPAFGWYLLNYRKKNIVCHEPEKVLAATALYKKQNDTYRQFMEENIMAASETSTISLSELYAQFKEWFREGFPGQTVPVKNEVRQYFAHLWGEPTHAFKWTGYKIRTMEDQIEAGNVIVLTNDDLVEYSA